MTPTVTYAAGQWKGAEKIVQLKPLRRWYSDADIKFEFYEDGRLKGFNSSSTGQGEPILSHRVPIHRDDALVLTYEGAVILEDKTPPASQEIPPDVATGAVLAELNLAVIGYVCATVTKKQRSVPQEPDSEKSVPQWSYEKSEADVLLSLREPGKLDIQLSAGGESRCDGGTIWQDSVLSAEHGTPIIIYRSLLQSYLDQPQWALLFPSLAQ